MWLNPFSPDIGWRDRGLDILVGALGVLSLAPFHIWPAMPAMLALLFVRAGRGHTREGWSAGFWTGFGYFSVGMFWIGQAFIERGPEYIPLIIPLVLGLFILLALFWGAAGALFARHRSRRDGGSLWDIALFAGLLFTAEYLRGHLFGGFPWNLPGYAFDAGTALSQFASWVGVYGLTLIVILVGAAAGVALRRRDRTAMAPAALAAALLAGLWTFGAVRLSGAEPEIRPDARLRLVHVPFRQREMMERNRATQLTNAYFAQTLSEPLDGITHIVWPEGAVRGVAMDNLAFLSVLPGVVESPPPFLFSSIRVEEGPQFRDGVRYFNTAVAVDYPDGFPRVAATADKRRLVPFGEIVPFGPVLEKIGLEAIAASFTPAPDKRVVDYPGLPNISVQICYEVIFSGLTEGEPDLILNQSNDAWFGGLHGPSQHAAISRMRALEEGAPLLRAAANGYSGLVDPYGRWIRTLSPRETAVLDVALVYRMADTRFSVFINHVLLFIGTALACVGFWMCRAARRGAG